VAVPDAERALCVVSAHGVNEGEVRITVRCIDAVLLPQIVEAKAKRIAERRGLSDRERQVLQLLLRGQGLGDIATTLDIATRTVKFHQANVLQKLGAQSRIDLLRVVL
jgi:DNA-binding NarL/FixJ family response regulator